jgi:glycosyltransferase involved in cell wall biosynthesis
MFVKNEENNLRQAIESVRPVVAEIVIVDTGSTDKTVTLARDYTDRVYQVGFSDFGSIRTLTAHLAMMPWVFMLDADERIDPKDWNKFQHLINNPPGVQGNDMELGPDGKPIIDSWALPRKRWADPWRTKQVDTESYPDLQVRLFRNHLSRPKIRFVRRVHERVEGCVQTVEALGGPTIHHHQNDNKSEEDLKKRAAMYKRFYELDVAEGIHHEEPPVIEEDDA